LSGYCANAQNTYPWLSNGSIGIGTASPSYKLDVIGTISGGVNDYSINSATYQLTNQSRVDGISGVSPTGAFRWYTNPNNSYRMGFLYQLRSYDVVNGESDGLVTVRGDGNVGIGTESIDRLLTVGGQIGITGNGVGLVFKNTNAANKLWDITPSGNDLAFGETGIATSFIIKSGGRVGIGTTSPNSLLDVSGGNIAVSNNLTVGGADGNGLKLFAHLGNPPYRSVDIVPFVPASAPGVDHVGLKIFTTNGGTTRVNAMTVSDAGNVIIGNTTQTNAAYKLDVYGSARANAIVVNTTGADFVFDNKYLLPKLSEVKAYIDKNHHLPEVPSANEMEANGIELGQMNAKLLQKVEELTLYLIEKDKQLIEEKQTNSHQQKQLKEQDARIAALEKALSKRTSK